MTKTLHFQCVSFGYFVIADSDALQEEATATIKNYIDGFNAFIIVSFQDRFFFNAEYLGAINHIELDSFDEGESYKPEA
jgi:hypothetical protein